MKIYSMIILFFFAQVSVASDLDLTPRKKVAAPTKRTAFNPLVSTSAKTLPHLKVGFQRASGANINSDVLNNALSVGLLERFEVGMVPLFFISSPGSFNFMLKANVYQGDGVDWSISYAENRYEAEVFDSNGQVVENPDLVLRSYYVGFNTIPVDLQNVTISPFLNMVCGHLDSKVTKTYAKSLSCESEWGVDLQYQYADREWFTLGYGNLRKAGVSAYESMHSGFGGAWSKLRPDALISRPSIGMYYTPDTKNTLLLVSTTFFEK